MSTAITRKRSWLTALACITVLAPVALGAQPASSYHSPTARQARSVYLTETARLEFIREVGSALYERGTATGTYSAPMVTLLTRHPNYITAVVTIFPRGGAITGKSKADYIVKNETGYFGGKLTITHGTGSYKHVSGRSLGISGTINRNTYNMTVKAHGNIQF